MQRGTAKPKAAMRCAEGLYLLFARGSRPDRSALIAALEDVAGCSISHDPSQHDTAVAAVPHVPRWRDGHLPEGHWLELLKWGMTFDCLGLAPGPAVALPPAAHRVGCPADLCAEDCEAIALVPGPHLADAPNSLPIVRAMLDIGADLVQRLDGVAGISWSPARSLVDPAFFSASVKAWIEGGAFPAIGMVGFSMAPTGRLMTEGLAWFIGQELEFAAELSVDKIEATRLAARLIHELVASGPVAEPCEIALGQGREVRLAPGRSGVLRVMPM